MRQLLTLVVALFVGTAAWSADNTMECLQAQQACGKTCVANGGGMECATDCGADAARCMGLDKKDAGGSCFDKLAGEWSDGQGTWTFSGHDVKLVLNSTNYGPDAQQITELELSSCDGHRLHYKITRAALRNTVDPDFAYDKNPRNAPEEAARWNKVYEQPYAIIGGDSLNLGTSTYTRK